jgi:predicted phosphodiesterase
LQIEVGIGIIAEVSLLEQGRNKMKITKLHLLISSLLLTSCFNAPDDPNPGQVTAHEKLTENYKVCVIGDSGKKSKGQRLVADVLKEEGCSQVRHTGDIIYSSGLNNADAPEFNNRFYDYYKPLLDDDIKFYMSMGNHDYKKKPEAWLELAKRHKSIIFPSMYYMDIYDDICFVTIDTNSRFFEQNSWRKDLKKNYGDTCKLTMAFGHHPLYSSGKHGNAILQFKVFLKSMIAGKVDAYFAGHEHNQEDGGKRKGTHYFVSGGAGEYRYIKYTPPVWAQAKLGYQTFTIHYDSNGQPFIKYFFYSVADDTGIKKLERSGEMQGIGFR